MLKGNGMLIKSLPRLAVLLLATWAAAPQPAAATAAADAPSTLGTRTYNIRDFGATGDGKTLDTPALQKAIDTCTADHGGTVLVPAGTFHIGTTELKSNITLHLAAGATDSAVKIK